METNTRYLKFKGQAEISEPIDKEKYIIIAGEFQAGDTLLKSNENGTEDEIISVSPIRLMTLKEGGEKLKLKTRSKASVRLRGALWHSYQESQKDLAYFDDWYEDYVTQLIIHLPEVTSLLGK